LGNFVPVGQFFENWILNRPACCLPKKSGPSTYLHATVAGSFISSQIHCISANTERLRHFYYKTESSTLHSTALDTPKGIAAEHRNTVLCFSFPPATQPICLSDHYLSSPSTHKHTYTYMHIYSHLQRLHTKCVLQTYSKI